MHTAEGQDSGTCQLGVFTSLNAVAPMAPVGSKRRSDLVDGKTLPL